MHALTWQTVVDALLMADRHSTRALPLQVARHRDRLLQGRVVTEHSSEGGSVQVAALCLVDAPMQQVWDAARDDDVVADPSVDERLLDTINGAELWYGRLRLPRPIADRQWVVTCERNAALEAASNGAIREWSWQNVDRPSELATRHMSAATLRRGRWIDEQQGAWLVADLGAGKTMLGYHARTSLGKRVPGWLIRDLVAKQVPPLVRRVANASEKLDSFAELSRHSPAA
ncbi:MAG: hypothetical protein ACI9MC_000974 [Kiritimatiellia bacterium]|jgi:hypothetical protein